MSIGEMIHPDEIHWIIKIIVSSLSLVGSLFIIIWFLKFRLFYKIGHQLILLMSLADFLRANTTFIIYKIEENETPDSTLCQI